jgi:hypothetical protein
MKFKTFTAFINMCDVRCILDLWSTNSHCLDLAQTYISNILQITLHSKFYKHTSYFSCRKNTKGQFSCIWLQTNLPNVCTVMPIFLMESGFPKSSNKTPHLAMNLIMDKHICRYTKSMVSHTMQKKKKKNIYKYMMSNFTIFTTQKVIFCRLQYGSLAFLHHQYSESLLLNIQK